jgi:hypothetical protein
MRALQGDDAPEVLGTVFSSVIALDRRDGVLFVAQFLNRETETAGEAALSLGESRTPEALEILKRQLEQPNFRFIRRTLFTAIALTRLREGTDFLLSLIRRDDRGAAEARQALLDCGALSEDERVELGARL